MYKIKSKTPKKKHIYFFAVFKKYGVCFKQKIFATLVSRKIFKICINNRSFKRKYK